MRKKWKKSAWLGTRHSLIDYTVLILLAALLCTYTLALASYHPGDPAINSIRHPQAPTHNLLGTVGAQGAGLILFYFGANSITILVSSLLYIFAVSVRGFSTVSAFRALTATVFIMICVNWMLSILAPLLGTHFMLDGFKLSLHGLWGSSLIAMIHRPIGAVGSCFLVSALATIAGLMWARIFMPQTIPSKKEALPLPPEKSTFRLHSGV